MPFADIATGAQLYYDERGQGAPLLLVHGLLGTAQLNFARVMDWLEPHYHLYGLTLRGYGQSTPKPRDFPLRFYHRDAADVLAFMDAVGLETAHILGFSDGGETALVAAGQQPERFLSVATIGAVGSFDASIRPRVQSMYPGTWISEADKATHGIPDANAFILGWIRAFTHYIDLGGDVSLSTADRITCPLLMLLGDQDTLNPAHFGQKFIDLTPRGQLTVFTNCGHAVHDEQFAEFQSVYGEFLNK
ncbi:MAG TPA: alpha/beta hydrolase [Phototrophicaceae bacterium]|nr:alpha/beta hydrolase [Phototrophicaceae bacterium]